ncbi:ATPase family [Ruminiclostridium hungatei]|uniref:ATPase family n=1 Tax=Ruminiclostridium hungatei TaxID=48256 RepID=A0A1V4SG23_RUMHU|nr:MoxR family ATPase [Ruminiclostridium hungatei]OPX42800.1 ATPase family [Ruminiclostridium hungatei]
MDTFTASQKVLNDVILNIEKVIIGKRAAVELIVLALISGGHVLIEDIPGVGKTTLVSALARSVSCGFKRIQFTPDIMPSDVTGFSVYNQKTGEFEFRPGAAMSNFLLADEINRASAKTQSSLLEIMEEKQVTVDSVTYKLDEPFMVLATQNPIEYLGTYPLPEAQIDRFLIKISLGYPSVEEEIRVVVQGKNQKDSLEPVASAGEILMARGEASKVYVSELVVKYIINVTAATRTHADVTLGSSPRGSIALYGLCQAFALYQGRDYVIPDDVKFMAPYALPHRLILKSEAKVNKKTQLQVIEEILRKIPVPVLKRLSSIK